MPPEGHVLKMGPFCAADAARGDTQGATSPLSPPSPPHSPFPTSPLRAGFIDDSFIAQRLNVAFKVCARTVPGRLSFQEFFAAAYRLGMLSPGNQPRLEALFDRYDWDGEGRLAYTLFSDLLVGLVPNPEVNANVRTAVASVRRALARTGGLTALLELEAALGIGSPAAVAAAQALEAEAATARGPRAAPILPQAASLSSTSVFPQSAPQARGGAWPPSSASPSTTPSLSRRAATTLLSTRTGGLVSYSDINTLLVEAARPNGGQMIIPADLARMLRGGISRRRRAAVGAAWAALRAAAGPGPVTAGRVVAALGQQAEEARVYLPLGGAEGAPVSEAQFVELYRALSPLVGGDEAFDVHLEGSFAVQREAPRGAAAGGWGAGGGAGGAAAGGGGGGGGGMTLGGGGFGDTLGRSVSFAVAAAPPRAAAAGAPQPPSSWAGATSARAGAPLRAVAPLAGTSVSVFGAVAHGRIPPAVGPLEGDADGNVVGACIRNTLGRVMPPAGKEAILGRPHLVPNRLPPAPFGAWNPRALPVGQTLRVASDLSSTLVGGNPDATLAAREYLRWAGSSAKGQPVWRHNRPSSLIAGQ
jgi:hypothetical protein